MNFNKYALVMITFVGIISVMMGTISSSYAQANQTMTTPKIGDNTSTSANATKTTASAPIAGNTNSSSSGSSVGHNAPVSNTYKTTAQNNSTTNKAGGPMDMIKNLFKSFTGGNK